MISLLESIELIKDILAVKPALTFENERPGDLRYFVADFGKFRDATGGEPKVRPEEGIRRLIK